VYEISTTQFSGKHRRVDIHAVRIGNKLAHEMPLADLHAAVKKMGVPRIEPQMGIQDVVLRLGVWQLEQLEQEATE
jgi:hypothetical protein